MQQLEQQARKSSGSGGGGGSSSSSARSKTLASQLRLLLALLVAMSLLSAGAISYRAAVATPPTSTSSPRLMRSAADSETVATAVLHGAYSGAGPRQHGLDSSSSSSRAHDRTASTSPRNASTRSARDTIAARPSPAARVSPAPLEPQTSGIPRIIHQSWKHRDAIPKRFAPWMRSWSAAHPTWTYVFWTDADNLALFETLYPQYLHVARSVGKIALADMARYALLHRVGGLYVDADFECVQPFDALLRAHELILSSEPRAHTVLLEHSASVSLCNALLASVPRHPFWLALLDAIAAKFARERARDPVGLTGPRILNATFFAHFREPRDVAVTGRATLLPSEYFYPEIAYWNMAALERACRERHDAAATAACAWLTQHPHGEFTNATHATHHWQCTWCNGDGSNAYEPLARIFAGTAHVPQQPQISRAGVAFAPMPPE